MYVLLTCQDSLSGDILSVSHRVTLGTLSYLKRMFPSGLSSLTWYILSLEPAFHCAILNHHAVRCLLHPHGRLSPPRTWKPGSHGGTRPCSSSLTLFLATGPVNVAPLWVHLLPGCLLRMSLPFSGGFPYSCPLLRCLAHSSLSLTWVFLAIFYGGFRYLWHLILGIIHTAPIIIYAMYFIF